jgi:hypothetical protein
LSATTQIYPVRYISNRVNPVGVSVSNRVKVLSPEILHIALGQGFHFLETNIKTNVKGEFVLDKPGSESVAGKRTVYIGTWENRDVPYRSLRGAEDVTRRYVVSVVGLIHNRGVGRVTPVAPINRRTLEGISSLTQREEVCHAAP